MDAKFREPEKDPLLNDVDFVNFYYDFKKIFENVKGANIISDTEVRFLDPDNLDPSDFKKPTFVLQPDNLVKVLKNNQFNIAVGVKLSKFMVFAAIRFSGNSFAAMSFIAYHIRKKELPYLRVGCDFLKVIIKRNRFGIENKILKSWKKEEISDDHGKETLKMIWKYDDFTIHPDNLRYTPAVENCYNLYAPFPHIPSQDTITEEDIPNTIIMMQHVFGEQYELGLKYMKILYELPTQILPVLILVSLERETGKTTFLNWIHMLFGENTVLISPHDLTSNFNSGYATKNIILIDETVIEKNTSAMKIISLATAKTISVSQKFVAQYSVPFFGKLILCTNKEREFMRIEHEEIRFWVRKINLIEGEKNTNIENDLFNEIPLFLKYLSQLPDVDISKSRMVFTKEEINTTELANVKEESKVWLAKELEILIDDFFANHQNQEFEATAKDIKEKWFAHNHQVSISYIRKILKHEMKMVAQEPKSYDPLLSGSMDKKMGRPYLFTPENHVPDENRNSIIPYNMPF